MKRRRVSSPLVLVSTKASRLALADEYTEGAGDEAGPEERKVHVYKQNEPAEVLDNPDRLSGEPALPGFVLGLNPSWEPGF